MGENAQPEITDSEITAEVERMEEDESELIRIAADIRAGLIPGATRAEKRLLARFNLERERAEQAAEPSPEEQAAFQENILFEASGKGSPDGFGAPSLKRLFARREQLASGAPKGEVRVILEKSGVLGLDPDVNEYNARARLNDACRLAQSTTGEVREEIVERLTRFSQARELGVSGRDVWDAIERRT